MPRFLTTLFANVLAGLTSGLVTLAYSISFAALIFSGNLAQFFPQGVGTALIGATVTALCVARWSSFPFTLAGPEGNSAVILALMTSTIAATLSGPEAAAALYPTVWAAIILSAITTGLGLYAFGRFRLGRWARFIPYPVIGGFLAGTGWLITRSAFKVMAGIPLGLDELPKLMHGEALTQWLAGALFALLLFFFLNRFKQFWVLPGLLLAAIVVFDTGWWLLDHNLTQLDPEGWFFKPFPDDELWQAWNLSTVAHIDWGVLLHQSGTLFAMMVIVMISILLNSTGLELATSRNVRLNQELRANGIANVVNGMCGGMVGYLSINRSLLNQQAGARGPFAAMVAGGLCGSVLLFGSSFLSHIPKPVLGGLLFYIGVNLLVRWVYRAWFQFQRLDYALIVLILIVIVTLGFLQGIGAGILIACLLFILSYGKTSSIKYTLSGSSFHSNVERAPSHKQFLQAQGECIYIMVLTGFIFFGTANDLLERVRRRLEDTHRLPPRFIVFDFRLVTGLDASAVLIFMRLAQIAQKADVRLVYTAMAKDIAAQIRQEQGLASIVCLHDLDRGIEWCEDHLLASSAAPHAVEAVPLPLQLQSLLPDAEMVATLLPYLTALKLSGGEYLFRQGASSDGLYFLESGQVTVVLELHNGEQMRRRTYNSGTIVGEMGLYAHAPRSASIIADTHSHLHHLSSLAFDRMSIEQPQLAAAFNKSIVNLLAERLRHCEDELKTMMH